VQSLVFDTEAVAIDGAADFLEPVMAPSNYVKAEAIAAYIEKAQREQLAKAALDMDLARIVCLGVVLGASEPDVRLAKTEDEERALLQWFWTSCVGTSMRRPLLIGFNCLGYDLPLLLRRSLYLGVHTPRLPINRYRHEGIEDLLLTLSYDGAQKMRGLAFYCKRFAIDVPDATTGADIAGLVAEAKWDQVAAHCRADILRTVQLAARLGVLQGEAVF
jgi:predicted PolB exonuclease-like 3'-5' exonuclease